MTVAVSVKVNDGVVLASDSATSLVAVAGDGTHSVHNVYNHANKVFNLRKGLPLGCTTWGAGSVGNSSTSHLIRDFRARLSDKSDEWHISRSDSFLVSDVASRLREFVNSRYVVAYPSGSDSPQMGFLVSGYSKPGDHVEEYAVQFGQKSSDPIELQGECTLTCNGDSEAIGRLVSGFSANLGTVLMNDLGMPPEQVSPALRVIQSRLECPMLHPAMPVQDAIDLARFLVHVTIQWSRFVPGPPTVGGPIEVAAISKHEGFKWVDRKHYYDRTLNPERSEESNDE